MRPIKFRARKGQSWIYTDNLPKWAELVVVDGVLKLRTSKEIVDDEGDGPIHTGRFNYEYHDLYQFTGLLDRNRKEIWECDVLAGNYGEQQKGEKFRTTGVVDFYNGAFTASFSPRRIYLNQINGNHAVLWYDEAHFTTPAYYYELTEIEVIGNIYENPEMVKP